MHQTLSYKNIIYIIADLQQITILQNGWLQDMKLLVFHGTILRKITMVTTSTDDGIMILERSSFVTSQIKAFNLSETEAPFSWQFKKMIDQKLDCYHPLKYAEQMNLFNTSFFLYIP